MNITAQMLIAAAPRGSSFIINAIVSQWGAVSAKYGVTTRNRALGFLSTCSEESGGFTLLSENDDYSAERAHVIFPSRFPTVASAQAVAGHPEAFANAVYDGRMGNRAGSDDGWTFRGQGLDQITGRDNFSALGKLTGLDLVNHPELVTSAASMLECAMALFVEFPFILTYCDDQNWKAVWALVGSDNPNGPVVNFGNHEAALAALQKVLPADGAGTAPPAAAPLTSIAVGSVVWTQNALNAHGAQPPLIVDGVAGELTTTAVKAFQARHGLGMDGVVGAATIAALEADASGAPADTEA